MFKTFSFLSFYLMNTKTDLNKIQKIHHTFKFQDEILT